MIATAGTPAQILRLPPLAWILAAVALAAGYVTFRTGVDLSAGWIWTRPEYSQGLIIPFIAAFLIWQQRDWLEKTPFPGAWSGVAVLLVGVALNVVGHLGGLVLQQYAVLVALGGLVLSMTGVRVFRRLWVALFILLFMIPLPEFLYQNLSTQLQLLSSRAGVWVIRQFGISVLLEGNVIDLGRMQLQVAEACDGLRYLFPLMTLGFIAAYFFKTVFWKRLIVFLSSIPITIGMNSLRIGLIGVAVEYWGPGMARGVLHQFEGWVVFMVSGAVMLLEIVLLARTGRDRRPWRQVFGVELPPRVPRDAKIVWRRLPRSFLAALLVLLATAALTRFLPERREAVPARRQFMDFPMQLAGRAGVRLAIGHEYLEVLQLDDYVLANFESAGAGDAPVNLYVAWYDTQRAGRSTHSPGGCLPAGGWAVEQFTQLDLPGVLLDGHSVRVNRALTRRGNERQLVYYFFKQRQRVLTGEQVVKWYLFWDGVTQNRTDGALVRFVTPLVEGQAEAKADQRLTVFAATTLREMGPYVPD